VVSMGPGRRGYGELGVVKLLDETSGEDFCCEMCCITLVMVKCF